MILITGGSGYIGSHAAVELLRLGENIIILDNLSNSSEISIKNIRKISNKEFKFIKGDLKDTNLLNKIFREFKISTVFHFSGLKSISESIVNPIDYYLNNVSATIELLKVMEKYKVYELIFSSSATVYDSENEVPWKETYSTQKYKQPYAENKIIIENLLKQLSISNKKWKIAVLRYFNPLGAHPSGLIGEFKIKNSTNLMPNIEKTFLGFQKSLSVYGGNYNTHDGTGVRDFIHIEDLIDGHLKAKAFINKANGFFIWNLGAGRGYSVLEVIQNCSEIFKKNIEFNIVNERKGDLGEYYADISKSKNELNWEPQRSLERMIHDTYIFMIKCKNNLF